MPDCVGGRVEPGHDGLGFPSLQLQDLNQPEPLAIKLHVRRKFPPPGEIRRVRLAPIFERAVAFPLVMGEGRVHVPEAPPFKLNGLQERGRPPLAVLDNPALADNDAFVGLASGPAGCGLLARKHEFQQFIGQLDRKSVV